MHKRAIAKITIVLAVAMVAAMGLLTATAHAQASPSATRSFSAATVDAGADVTVTIAVANYGGFGRVAETLPAGFTYKSSSLEDSQVRASGQEVRFTLQAESSFTYTVTAPSTAGPHAFSGELTDSNRNKHAVGGDSSVTVRAAQATSPSATRSFSPAVARPGADVTVTIAVANYGGFGRVAETLPAGFTYKSSSLEDSQVNTSGGQMIRFTLQADTSFTYTVTASSTAGSYAFSGELTDSNRNKHAVGGATMVTVRRPPPVVTPPPNRAPVFGEGNSASRSVEENSAPGTAVGSPVTATDPERGRLTYSLSGTDAALFDIDSASGQISVAEGTDLDFESEDSYAVTVQVMDPARSRDTISIAIGVTNVDEDGEVTLSPAQPAVGTEITATLMDPDGSVSDLSWRWERSLDGATWTAVSVSDAYTPVAADRGRHLRATASYTDGHGGDKTAEAALPALPPVQSVDIDVTVWRSVSTGNIYVSTRPEGESWTTHNTPIDLSNLSRSGRFYQGLPVTVSVDVGGGASADIDVTVWRSLSTENIYVSTRPEGERWTTHNTPIDLSNLSRSGRFYQGLPVTVEVDLR